MFGARGLHGCRGVLGIACSAAGVVFSPQLLQVMGVPDNIFGETLAYTRIYFGGIWSMILYNMAAGILRAFGDSKSPLYVLVLCSLSNVVGDYLLVGLCGLGVEGAAAATVAAQIISVVCAFVLLNRVLRGQGILSEGPLWGGSKYAKGMVVTGFPLALQSMLFPVANSIVQVSVNRMGSDSIAAWGVCNKLDMFVWLAADAMGPALTTYVAQNLGAGKKHRINKGVLTGTAMSVGTVSVISLFLYLGAGAMGGLVCLRRRRPDSASAGSEIYADDGSLLCVLRSGGSAVRGMLRHGKYIAPHGYNACNGPASCA